MGLNVSAEALGQKGLDDIQAGIRQRAFAILPEVVKNPDNVNQSLHERIAGEALSLAAIPRDVVRSLQPQYPKTLFPEFDPVHAPVTVGNVYLLPGRGQPRQAVMLEELRIAGQIPAERSAPRSVVTEPQRGVGRTSKNHSFFAESSSRNYQNA